MDEDEKKLGFVADGSERGGRRRGGMEKNELAEETACSGRDDDIDPDALSYIDEKIQNVLGHFQREFEGGVYGESLGAKFGGYGSFLPVFTRSPSISLQPKSPVKTPNHNVLRSPSNLQSQDGHQNPSILGNTSITKVSVGSEGPLTEKSGIKKSSIFTLRSERILQSPSKPVNLSDKKMQELCMMVGNEEAFPRKKPEIYGDLGLDVSPSPSPDDISNRNEVCSSESADAFLESPTTILQIMTCFSVPGGYILSPLPDSLQNSNGKEENFLTNFKTGVLRKVQTETCAASSDTSLNLKFVDGSTCKKAKSGDKSQMLWETDRLICKGDVMPFLKKETGAETLAAQKVICNAPDISQSSRASFGDAREERLINGSSATEICNTTGNLKASNKLSLKKIFPVSHVSTDSHAEFVENIRNDFAGNSVMESIHSNGEVNSKSGLTTKSFGERIGNNQDTLCQPTETRSRALKNFNTKKADSKSYDSGLKNHAIKPKGTNQNQIPAQKAASCEEGKIDQPCDGETIHIGSPTNGLPCTEPSRENLRTSSSVELKRKNGYSYESKLEEKNSHKNKKKSKAVESHNAFGESTHIQKVDENKHSFGSSRFNEKSKLELGLDKFDNHQIANFVNDELGIAPLACNAPTSDADSRTYSSVIKENWVFCDLCQTWRLLPYGTNPDKLPKEWQCSMQVWLPGLNKCYISEDETTKAFHQFYPVPAPVCGTYLTVHPDAAVSGIASDDILHQNQSLDNNACSIPSGVKAKNGLLDVSSLPNSSSLSYSTSSGKKLRASSENRNLNVVVRNSLDKDSLLKHGIRQTSRSAEISMEKQNDIVEEKPFKIPASSPNEGDLFGKGCENSRLKRRKQVDLSHRSSKKIKKDALHYSEKNMHAEDEISGKIVINGDYDLPLKASRKVLQNTCDHFSSEDFNSKFAPSKNPKKSIRALSNCEHKEHVTASRTEKNCKYDSNEEMRGIKENSMAIQQLVENRPMIKDASVESEQKRKKRSKLANSTGQDSSGVILDENMDKKGCFTKIKLPSEKYQPDKVVEATIDAFECVDGMNKDMTNVQLAAAATSSSSKLLGSHRSKVNLQEARESLVESVSSSPIRLLNTKDNSKKVRLSTKVDILSAGPSMKCFPKSNFLGDVDATVQSGTRTEDQASKSHPIISKNSKATKPKASSNHLSQITVDRSEGSSGKMAQTCHTVTGQHEKNGWGSQTVHRSMQERNSEHYRSDAVNSKASNSTQNLRKSDCLNEIHSKNLSQPSPIVPECTPTKRDGHININAFIQEARDLKHTASRLKNDGLERESSGLYFEASMKFLHVAFLMEPPNSEIERQGDFIPSLQMLTMYVDTARLCEFCAHEYENLKEMAAAALAYKCAEVAYMKVAYFKHPSASKDRHELQAALDAALPGVKGESTASTSDVDNLNNQEVFEKAASTMATRSPQLASSYVIAARNRPHIKRLLTYTNYLNCAFEATNKSRNALAAASIDLDKDRVASLCLVREALDFNFNNVERLLQLVRVSLNSISCEVEMR